MESKDVRRILPNWFQLRFQIWKVRWTSEVQFKIPCKFKGLEGIQSFYYALGISAGFVMISCGLGTRLFQMGAQTIPDIFSLRYDSFFLKKVVACCSVVTLFLILTAVLIAGRKLFYSLGFTQDFFFVFSSFKTLIHNFRISFSKNVSFLPTYYHRNELL